MEGEEVDVEGDVDGVTNGCSSCGCGKGRMTEVLESGLLEAGLEPKIELELALELELELELILGTDLLRQAGLTGKSVCVSRTGLTGVLVVVGQVGAHDAFCRTTRKK